MGASAGGIDACAEFLRHLPAKTGLAFALAQDFEVVHTFPKIGIQRMLLNAHRLEKDINGESLILLSIEEQST